MSPPAMAGSTTPTAPTPVVEPPSFDIVRVAPTGSAVIAGRAAPGLEVTVKSGDVELGRAVADARGEWVVLPKEPLASGTHRLGVETKAGLRSEEVAVLVPERKSDKAEQPLAVLLPKNAVPRPLEAPKPGLGVDAVEYDQKGEVVVGGHAKPGAEVRVYLGGAPLATVTADESGRWETKPTQAIDPGTYTLRADEMRPDGSVAARVAVPFQRVTVTSGGPGDRVVVQPGDNLWNLARQTYGSGPRYAVIYAANQTLIRDPDLIYPGQVFTLPSR